MTHQSNTSNFPLPAQTEIPAPREGSVTEPKLGNLPPEKRRRVELTIDEAASDVEWLARRGRLTYVRRAFASEALPVHDGEQWFVVARRDETQIIQHFFCVRSVSWSHLWDEIGAATVFGLLEDSDATPDQIQVRVDQDLGRYALMCPDVAWVCDPVEKAGLDQKALGSARGGRRTD